MKVLTSLEILLYSKCVKTMKTLLEFLEAIENVLADNETSMMLKPFVTKIKMALFDGRRSVKRRICNMQNNEDSIYDEERNFLDVFDE